MDFHRIHSNKNPARLTESISVSKAENCAASPSDQFLSNHEGTRIVSTASINATQQALLDAGIHLDNAKATLQILGMPGADRRAILYDVARSIHQSERELAHAFHGKVARETEGRTAHYDFQEIQAQIGELRRYLMREMHTLSPSERTPIFTLLNPPFEQIV